jgi:hypothetical protein
LLHRFRLQRDESKSQGEKKMSYRSTAAWYSLSLQPFVCFLGLVSGAVALAQAPLVKIEEDWELSVLQPNEQLDAPQLTTTMLPFGTQSDLLFQVDWNHASVPAFARGGFQLRVGANGEGLAERHELADQQLYVADEVVRWTQVVQKTTGGFSFGVVHGLSASWGSFGGGNTFLFIPDQHADGVLNSYTIADSLSNSGVTYAGNRVARLRLLRVRFVDAAGQAWEVAVDSDVQ